MSKNQNNHNRSKNITVAFRVTEIECNELNMRVKLSGLSKQNYLTNRVLQRDIVVIGNPRVYKALRDKVTEILEELKKLRGNDEINVETLIAIQAVTEVLNGLNKND